MIVPNKSLKNYKCLVQLDISFQATFLKGAKE